MFVDLGSSRPGRRHKRRRHFWERRKGVLDKRVGQRQMELTDRLQALEPPGQGIGEIPEFALYRACSYSLARSSALFVENRCALAVASIVWHHYCNVLVT